MRIRKSALAAFLMPFLALGIAIGCSIAESKPESDSAKMAEAERLVKGLTLGDTLPSECNEQSLDIDTRRRCDRLSVINDSIVGVRLALTHNCVDVLTHFDKSAHMVRRGGIDSASTARLRYMMHTASAVLTGSGCPKVLPVALENFPDLQRVYREVIYYRLHGKLPSLPQQKTKTPTTQS